jgi:cell division protein FtsA
MSARFNSQLIAGIDIGSTAIRAAVGQYGNINGQSGLHILATVEVVSEGVAKGTVTSIEDAVSAISGGLEQLERLIGTPIESAWVGLGGTHIMTQTSKGVIAVAKSDGEIGREDVERVVEAARMIAPPLNYEMLHIIPRGYTVDNQTGIKDPVGMTGIRLEVDAQIIHGLSTHINNLNKTVHRAGIEIDDVVISILADGEVVTTPRQRDLGCVVVNIGGALTSVVIYEAEEIKNISILPIGSMHVTNDLALGLRTSIDVAERVKLAYGSCVSDHTSRREKIDLLKLGAESEEIVSRQYIAEIVEARMLEILEMIDVELQKVERSGLLPAGVIFTGGGSKINGLIELSREFLRLPSSLGYPMDILSSTDKINDLSFTTAIGLVKWGSNLQLVGKPQTKGRMYTAGAKGVSWLKGIAKSLMP